ncbi:hypothetical protein D3C87_1273120 [compost metagenome]
MEYRRVTCGGAGLDVGRAADDNAGHRQGAEQAAEHVADTLRRQFPVEVRALAAVHPVYRGSREQGFGTGDESHGEGSDEQGRVCQIEQVCRAQPINGFPQVGRHFHPFDLQRQEQAGGGGKTDAEQGTWNKAQGVRAQFFPQPHHGDGR